MTLDRCHRQLTTFCVIAAVVAHASSPAHARAATSSQAPDTGADAAVAPSDPVIEEARALYEEGVGRYETADYPEAIELWTKAYTLIPNDTRGATIKALLISNLAAAREKAYEVDRDLEQLRQAQLLLADYLTQLATLYADPAEREKERSASQARLDRVEERIAAHEASLDDREDAKLAQADEAARARALTAAGATLTGLGGAALAVCVTGMIVGAGANDVSGDLQDDYDARGDQFARGHTGNVLAIIGGAAAGVLVATGIALLVTGKKKRGAAIDDEQALVWSPMLAPRQGGVAITGRF